MNRATNFQQLSSNALVAKTITITIPGVHVDRIKEMLRKALGRELTPDEHRYLGLSSSVVSTGGPEKGKRRSKTPKLRVLKKAKYRKAA